MCQRLIMGHWCFPVQLQLRAIFTEWTEISSSLGPVKRLKWKRGTWNING